MKAEQIGDRLIITETPGCLWIFGLFFAFVGSILIYGAFSGLSNSGGAPVWQLFLAVAMGAVAVCAGAWVIYRAPANEIFINRHDQTVVFKRSGLSGKTQTIYKFDEINRFCLIEDRDDESNLIWSLGFEKIDGETIKISSLASHDESFKRNFVFQINEFMCKQISPAQAVLELEDESGGEIS